MNAISAFRSFAFAASTAPAVRELLADGVPRNRKGIVEALAGRHGKDDVVRTVMRMSVTGELDEVGRKFTLAVGTSHSAS